MIYDRHQIERIKDANPIEEVINDEYPLGKRGSEFKALCPFHQEKSPSFNVSPRKKFYHCFGCGAHGDVVKWIMVRRNITFQEALSHLAQRAHITP